MGVNIGVSRTGEEGAFLESSLRTSSSPACIKSGASVESLAVSGPGVSYSVFYLFLGSFMTQFAFQRVLYLFLGSFLTQFAFQRVVPFSLGVHRS